MAFVANAASTPKRKLTSGQFAWPRPKRPATCQLDLTQDDNEESDEIEIPAAYIGDVDHKAQAKTKKYRGVQAGKEPLLFPAPKTALSKSEMALRERKCEERLLQACKRLEAERADFSPRFAKYVYTEGAEKLAKKMMLALLPAWKHVLGSDEWSMAAVEELAAKDLTLHAAGLYFAMCDRAGYIGSSVDLAARLAQHVNQIVANRKGSAFAEHKLFYNYCTEAKPKPVRFAYVAIPVEADPEFIEVMESVLISIFGTFERGLVKSMVRQVRITKAIRPQGLPATPWLAGNASLPVCMAFQEKPTEEQLEASMKRCAEARGLWNKAQRDLLQTRKLEAAKEAGIALVYCEACQIYGSKDYFTRTNKYSHKMTETHQLNLPPEERTERVLTECGCGKSYDPGNKNSHTKGKHHQKWLSEEERDGETEIWCEVCEQWQ